MKTRTQLITIIILGMLFSCSQKTAPTVVKQVSESVKITEKPIVFITGIDKDDNKYYSHARTYFEQQKYIIVDDITSLEGIINWLNSNINNLKYNKIHIVSHSNSWRGMSLTNIEHGERIRSEILDNCSMTKLNPELCKNTKIVFHSCGLGQNTKLMKQLKNTFSDDKSLSVYASPFFNIFGGKFADHYLSNVYYTYYPTAHTPGKTALSKALTNAYPDKKINWLIALNNRSETNIGKVYSYKFNVPIEWEIAYTNGKEVPNLDAKDAIMDFIVENEDLASELFLLNIPIEQFRWRSKIKKNTLIIKGKSTVVCILEPKMKPNNSFAYMDLDIENTDLYQKL
jgi:hypothetical protein